MKIKNENQLKQNIQEKLNALNTCLSELDQAKHELGKCRQAIGDADSELTALGRDKFVSIENAGAALESADKNTARKKELIETISANQARISSLQVSETNLDMKIHGLKEPLRAAREAYCVAFEAALKTTAEWKKAQENFSLLKALWLETFSGNIYLEDVAGDMGLHEMPEGRFTDTARAELLIR